MSEAVDIARRWVGTPYVHQASVRGAGADCLGLVRGVWRELLGVEPAAVPPYTPDWDEVRHGEALWAAAQAHLLVRPGAVAEPGDVLLFRMREGSVAKHLGILSAGDRMPRFIHAYSGHGVVENSLSAPWRRRLVAAFGFPGRAG